MIITSHYAANNIYTMPKYLDYLDLQEGEKETWEMGEWCCQNGAEMKGHRMTIPMATFAATIS